MRVSTATPSTSIYVAGLAADCPAAGQLNEGDRVIDINGTTVDGLAVDEVNRLITATPPNSAMRT